MDRLRRTLIRLVPYGLVIAVGGTIGLVLFSEIQDLRGIDDVELHDPFALALLLGCALVAWVGFHLHVRRSSTFAFSRVGDLARTRRGFVSWLTSFPRALRVVALALIAVGLARPQTYTRQEVEVEGIDMMIVLDLSKSMEERDLRPSRIHAARRTIRKFLEGRKSDRIGLVVFAKEAMVQCPLTLDYAALDQIVDDLSIGDVEPMGTAIGDGLGLALANLRRSDARSKIVVLLSDGDSNTVNEMDPDEATETTRFALRIPRALSLIAFHDPDAEVKGLDAIPRDDWPNVHLVHWSFQLMVALGVYMAVLALWAGWVAWRTKGKGDGEGGKGGALARNRPLMWALAIATPMGFIATEAGWMVTELGRQPWVIYGIVRTRDAVTPMPGLVVPFVLFTLLYCFLGAIVAMLLYRQIVRSPNVPESVWRFMLPRHRGRGRRDG